MLFLGYVNINTLRPRRNGRHFPGDIFKWIFLNENVWISIKISLKFVPNVPIKNIPALVQIMAWRRSGDKPLSEPMMVRLPTHICVTRPQWVKSAIYILCEPQCVHSNCGGLENGYLFTNTSVGIRSCQRWNLDSYRELKKDMVLCFILLMAFWYGRVMVNFLN